MHNGTHNLARNELIAPNLSKKSSHYRFEIINNKKDIFAVISLAKQAHEESRFCYIPFSKDKTAKIAKTAIKDRKRHAVMLAFKDQQPVGLLYCSVGEYHIGKGVLLATVHNINVLKKIRGSLGGGKVALGLLRGATTWAAARNAKELLLHATSDIEIERFEKLVTRVGFKSIGGSYVKGL